MEGPWPHKPVLLGPVVELLAGPDRRVLVDCTIGLGGHAEALLDACGPSARLVGIDVDESNLRQAKKRLDRFGGRVRLFQANFSQLEDVLSEASVESVDSLLADLGVASSQLDDASRGLSFSADGPLDMRLDGRLGQTAADLIQRLGERELADLIYAYGEERYSRRIARAIVAERRQKKIERTLELANLIVSAYPYGARKARHGVHPATRTFQAIRIAVNDELGNLDRLLDLLPKVVSIAGRAAIITFHSLEDRRVKQAFSSWAANGCATLLNRRVVTPAQAEAESNPRSRSAKLRAIQRLA